MNRTNWKQKAGQGRRCLAGAGGHSRGLRGPSASGERQKALAGGLAGTSPSARAEPGQQFTFSALEAAREIGAKGAAGQQAEGRTLSHPRASAFITATGSGLYLRVLGTQPSL